MKRFCLIAVFAALISFTTAANSLGVVATKDSANATFSMAKLEFELGLTPLSDGILYVSADYNVLGDSFNIASVNGFFWNFAIGANTSISGDGIVIGAIFPLEFGYSFPVLETAIDVYLQATPVAVIYPSLDFEPTFGLGVRIGL